MAEASKPSFLGSLSPWSRSSTPVPPSPRQLPKDDGLKQSSGNDHTISLRPSPSLRRYPKDCPPLRTRWYYAVDVAKRKPFAPDSLPDDKTKTPPIPKKLVPFSNTDSQAIEAAFQSLDKGDTDDGDTNGQNVTSTRVPVNEDYLFDVHIEKRELEPAYWLGPVYEVRRASWFYQEGSTLRPCDENLANQLEEGYLKVAPWRRTTVTAPRSSSQPRSRPTSAIIDGSNLLKGTMTPSEAQSKESATPNQYRLFGAHMNTTATYQDANAAILATDDFMSRMSSTVYGRFGSYGGTKVVRGWSEPNKTTEGKTVDPVKESDKRRSWMSSDEVNSSATKDHTEHEAKQRPKRTALERQMSSLAGLEESKDSDELAEEEAREQEEKEMEDAREKDGDDQGREIDHLVLVTHGIGQRLGLRLDSINFIHDVNTMRKTMKAVYESAPDLQALSGLPKNCRIQVLPVCWRHLLDFPKQSLKQNRKEFDLGDIDAGFDDEYPSLQDITVEGVPAVRNLITDLAMDILLYQSAYREHIASIVQKEANRVYQLFKKRTGFSGKVSLCGHSLGSAILFDIMCRQEEIIKGRPKRVMSKTSKDLGIEQADLKLDFPVENFFALGSPIALFQMLKGRTVAGRHSLEDKELPLSPFDPDPMSTNPFDPMSGTNNMPKHLIPITTSSPKCEEFYNIFHPTDPIAYRIEPLISPAMAQLKPQALPYTKKGLFAAPGIANISARVGQQVMSSWYNLTSGVASSLINRSLGITGEEQALPQDRGRPTSTTQLPGQATTQPGILPQAVNGVLPIADNSKQKALADTLKHTSPQDLDSAHIPTLIDSELETLYSGFQKRRRSQTPSSETNRSSHTTSTPAMTAADSEAEQQAEAEKSRRLRREEAKVKALNSNGRVDYSIQEGMFDVSLLASIASHLSYWADEDVVHFVIGQLLKKGRVEGRKRDGDHDDDGDLGVVRS